MNHAAEELFGYSAGQAVNEIRVEKLYPPGGATNIMRMLQGPEHGGMGKLSGWIAVVNSKNEEIPVYLTASILYEDEEEIATMGIYHDLRRRLEAEAKLKSITAQLYESEKMASMGRWQRELPTRSTTH